MMFKFASGATSAILFHRLFGAALQASGSIGLMRQWTQQKQFMPDGNCHLMRLNKVFSRVFLNLQVITGSSSNFYPDRRKSGIGMKAGNFIYWMLSTELYRYVSQNIMNFIKQSDQLFKLKSDSERTYISAGLWISINYCLVNDEHTR